MSADHTGRSSTPTGLARVTVSAPQRRVDVALPEHVPLAELLPEVLRHAGEGLADDGERHGGWLLRRTDGVALAPAQGLFAQGVRDGEVLYLVPAQVDWPELEFDDVVEVIAESARRQGAAWAPAHARAAALAAAAAPLGVALLAVLWAGPDWGLAGPVGLGAALLLVLAGTVASRAYGDGRTGTVLAGYALPFALAGGALLVATGDPVGMPAVLSWLGAPQLLVGAVAVLLAAVGGLVGAGGGRQVSAAGILIGGASAVTALVGLVATAAGAAAVLAAALVCGVGVLPLLAIRFGRLPTPPVTLPLGTDTAAGFDSARPGGVDGALDSARRRPDRGRVFAAVARTEELLTGLLAGHALLAIAAVLVLVTTGGLAARLLAGITAVALLLRARLFATARQRLPLLGAGLIGLGLLGAALVLDAAADADRGGLLALVLGAMLAALAVVVAVGHTAGRAPTPYLGRLADLLDTTTMISMIPVACAVLGLYGRMRGLGS